MRGRELFLEKALVGAGEFGKRLRARGLDPDEAGWLIGNYERVRDGEMVVEGGMRGTGYGKRD